MIPSVPAEESSYDAVRAARELSRSNETVRRSKEGKLQKFKADTRRRSAGHGAGGGGRSAAGALEWERAGVCPRVKLRTEFEQAYERAGRDHSHALTLLAGCM
jgi:hypothetical protein